MSKIDKEINIPDDMKYSRDHQWIKMIDDVTGLCGLTDFVQNNLGEIVFVEFINNIVNRDIEDGEKIAIIESLKDEIDVFTILPGNIIGINRTLEDTPELINSDPYDEGWIYKIELKDISLLEDLIDPDEYIEIILPE